MKHFLFLLLLSGALLTALPARAIHPRVHNFTKEQFNAGNQVWDIAQRDNNWMYFANNNGLLEYDGTRWQLYPIGNYTDVRSVCYDPRTDRIYAGAFNELGYYANDERGILRYTSLTGLLGGLEPDFNEIWDICLVDDAVLFQGGREVLRYRDGRMWRHAFNHQVDCAAAAHGIFFVAVEREGVFMLNGDLFLPLPGCEALLDKTVCSILPVGRDSLLMATDFHGLFLFDGERLRPYHTDIDAFIKENQTFCAQISGHRLAIGTVQGGLVVKDLRSGTNTYSDIRSGLQNNTVLSVNFDNRGNLWVGLDKGIDYVMINSPIYNLLAGGWQYGAGYTAQQHGGWLYLGTNQGLYRTPWPIPSTWQGQQAKPVGGIQGQVWNLREIDGTLFCATNYGLYMIKEDRAERIGTLPGTWNVKPLRSHPGYILGSSYNGFFLLRKSGGQWRFAHHVDGFGESGSMFEEDTLGRIWFSHWMKGIYKLTLNDGLTAFDSVELLDTAKGFYSPRNNFVFKVRDRLLFSGDGGFFTYDEAMDRMTHCAEAEAAFGRNPYGVKLVESPDGNIWMLTNTDLQLARKQPGGQYDIDRQTFAEMKDKMIPGFEQFYFVNDSNLIINTDEGFAWIDLDKAKHPHPALKVSIHSLHLTSRQDSLAAGYIARQQEVPEYDYRDNSLRFEYAAPEYESPASVTYSCLLENYDNDWSRYTHANAKEYTKLPQGDYVFRVRAQSGVDGQQAETSFRFTILPPWYLSPAAYGTYAVLLLAMLYAAVLLIKRHSQKSALKVKEQKEQEMREQEQRFLEEKKMQQQEITKLKNQKLQYELRHKSRDLANSTMNVIRKNEILLDINNNLVKIADDIRSEKHPAELLKHIERVQDDIRKNIERDDNWKKFETNFDIVYENYLKRLGTDYPALTVSDKKLCAYLKMGLSSKDIAPLLNMSFRSVEMSRYRLRKKLNLNRDVNLTEFLQSY